MSGMPSSVSPQRPTRRGQTRCFSRAWQSTLAEGLCLDTGALIAVERGSSRVRALLRRAERDGLRVEIVAGVVAQAWRGGPRQARLARLLGAAEVTIADLDGPTARAVGELCSVTGTSDVVDAHVALHARRHRLAVVTSDPDDFAAFGSQVAVISL
jgi:predicted nucleic acid-binding protein